MSKKNLDDLFREKFEDFTDAPTEQVWKSIESSLDKKKKSRKVIPIWWKLGGIAAVLAIGLLIMNPFKGDLETNQTISDIENTENQQEKQLNKELLKTAPEISTGEVSASESTKESSGSDHNVNQEKTTSKQQLNKVGPTIMVVENSPKKSAGNENNANSVVVTSNRQDSKEVVQTIFEKETESTIAQNTSDSGLLEAILEKEESKNELSNAEILNLEKDKVIDNVAITEDDKPSISREDNKKSLFDEIEAKEEGLEIAEESTKNKWSAGPSIAPVYFNAIGKGSPVHSIFVPNSKSGDVNLSYGLAVSYEINNRLSVKTGIHKVDFGYNTNDVEFSSSLQGIGNGQIENIDYSAASRNIVVESNINKAASFSESKTLDFAAQNASLNGVMAQQFGYLEIPLELNYSLIDSKVGVNLIGGVSSLFLVDNSIILNSGDLITEIGEANNINNVNFSTNIGFGINYKFTKRIQFNVEPVFKYQLNTFSQTSGDFRPFTIGVYSGLNFKF